METIAQAVVLCIGIALIYFACEGAELGKKEATGVGAPMAEMEGSTEISVFPPEV